MRRCRQAVLIGLLAAACAGCAGSRFRHVDPAGDAWLREAAGYPRVTRLTRSSLPPRTPESVDVYHALQGEECCTFGEGGRLPPPPKGLRRLADLAVLRRAPDHRAALDELRRMAAEIGAGVIVEARYTVILGESWLGGAELVAWVYEATAACVEESP
jgi:hypothetical protein